MDVMKNTLTNSALLLSDAGKARRKELETIDYSTRSRTEQGELRQHEHATEDVQWLELCEKYSALFKAATGTKLVLTLYTCETDYTGTDGEPVRYSYITGCKVCLGNTGIALKDLTYIYDAETYLQAILLGVEVCKK
jgi:hypothetical protein